MFAEGQLDFIRRTFADRPRRRLYKKLHRNLSSGSAAKSTIDASSSATWSAVDFPKSPIPMKPKRAALYLRVSTDAQNTDSQRQELEAWAERAGHTVVKVYEDQGISGAKGRDLSLEEPRSHEGAGSHPRC